jgi:hypothetical protein
MRNLEGGRHRHHHMYGGETVDATADLEAGKAKGAKAHSKGRKAVVAKAKRMCVKASGSTSKIRASVKKAKKSKSAMKKRCNSERINSVVLLVVPRVNKLNTITRP